MRKIFISLMAVVLFIGCTKEDKAPANKELKVVFTVSEKAGFSNDTKAIKTGWVEGDQILLVFRPHNLTCLLPFAENTNTIKLTYTAGKWVTVGFNGDVALLSSAGYYSGIHHYGDVAFDVVDANDKVFLKNYTGGDFLESYGSYTISDGVLDLGEINMTRDADAYIISVRELASVEGPWTMKVGDNNNTNTMIYDLSFESNCLFLESDDSTGGLRNMGAYGSAGGSVNGTDISFYFEGTNEYKGNTYYFTVTNGTDSYQIIKEGVDANTLQSGKAYYLPNINDPRWTKID